VFSFSGHTRSVLVCSYQVWSGAADRTFFVCDLFGGRNYIIQTRFRNQLEANRPRINRLEQLRNDVCNLLIPGDLRVRFRRKILERIRHLQPTDSGRLAGAMCADRERGWKKAGSHEVRFTNGSGLTGVSGWSHVPQVGAACAIKSGCLE
jgi:hypothetical protein